MKIKYTFFVLFSVLIFGSATLAFASTSGSPLVLKDGHQAYPRIYGSNVVYANNGGTNWGLSYINLATKEQRDIVSPVTGIIFFEGEYDVSNTKIVYRYGTDIYGSDIYLYDIPNGTSKKISSNGFSPSISGNYIVWYSNNNGIMLYDIAIDKTTEITTHGTVGTPGGFVRPRVYSNTVVYEADANGKPGDLYLYDIPSGQSSKIGFGLMPRIYGDYVIWSAGFGNTDPITLYQISTQTQKVIGSGKAGEIYSDTVVYWSAVDNEVHLYTISSGKTLTGFGNGGVFTGPDIYEKTLVWADNRTSPLPDIYFIDITESPTCTSWIYSSWSSCSPNGNQTRSVTSSSPNSCVGGNPVLSQSCTYIPPIPSCTSSDWSCANWGVCSQNSSQTRTCAKISNCQGGVSSPVISQSCTYTPPIPTPTPTPTSTPPVYQLPQTAKSPDQQCKDYYGTNYIWNNANNKCIIPVAPQPSCTEDVWTCGDWNSCSLSGVQNRSCKKTFDCSSVETAPPVTDQYCVALNRPPQQIPQDSSAIPNQDTIIKATVKLMCPFDEKWGKWNQGSGTIIDQSGTILTNKHVVDRTLGCLVGFINNFNDEPYFGERQIADIVKVTPNADIAILKIRNPRNQKLSYINIAGGNSSGLQLGDRISIYGYPGAFGKTITYTSGDFSGTRADSYLKTTAILEYGNSGGGAYLKNGTFIGIPSAVTEKVKDTVNVLGYILPINIINAWLGNSSIAYNTNNSQNNYSRVSSILENVDLKTLGSVQLIVPGTKEYKEITNTPSEIVNPIFTRSLKMGMSGKDVKQLQTLLKKLNYLSSNHIITNYFGPITNNAVIKFQKDNNINPALGFFGPITQAKIVSLTKK